MFLHGSGIPYGRQCVAGLKGPGLPVGAALLLATIVPMVLAISHLVLRIRNDDLFGVCPGATGNPVILAGANRLLGADRADVGYAIVFPTMTIAKIVAVQPMLG